MSVMTQCEYITILLNDLGYDTTAQRCGWFDLRFNVRYPDDLTIREKAAAIDMLKEEKRQRRLHDRG